MSDKYTDDGIINPDGVVWGHPASGIIKVLDKQRAYVEESYLNTRLGTDGIQAPRTKAAIVGFSITSMHLAPYADPEWSIWGVNQLYRHIPRADRWFELHTNPLVDQVEGTDYMEWMKRSEIPIYMQECSEEIPNSVTFPLKDIINRVSGRDYFTSTIAYMIALAILDGFEEIALYGVDLADDSEYFHQKPCAEYWLGIAEAKGIKVHVHERSSLLKQYHRYGYEELSPDIIPIEDIEKRMALLQHNITLTRDQRCRLEGAFEEASYWRNLGLFRKRGGVLSFEEAIRSGHVNSHRAYDKYFAQEAMRGTSRGD